MAESSLSSCASSSGEDPELALYPIFLNKGGKDASASSSKRKASAPATTAAAMPTKKTRSNFGSWRTRYPKVETFMAGSKERVRCLLCKTDMWANAKSVKKHWGSKQHLAKEKSLEGEDGNIVQHIEGRTTGHSHLRADMLTFGYYICKWGKAFSDAPKMKELMQSLNMVDQKMANDKAFCMSDTYMKDVTVLKYISNIKSPQRPLLVRLLLLSAGLLNNSWTLQCLVPGQAPSASPSVREVKRGERCP